MTPHSSTLAWEISWMEEPGRLQSMGHKESDMTERTHRSTHTTAQQEASVQSLD